MTGAAECLPPWRLVLVMLAVLLPLPGFAQALLSSPPLVPTPSMSLAASSESEQGDPYGGYDDDEPQEEAPRAEIIPRERDSSGKPKREGLRIITETFFGFTLGLVGIAPGAYLAFAQAASDSSDSGSGVGPIALGFVGVTAGATLGVFGGGTLWGGEGRFSATLLGATLGAFAGAFLAIPAALAIQGGWVVPVLLSPVIGALIGYESSNTQEQEAKAAQAGTQVEMVPLMGVRPSGGLVAGLAGRF